MEPVFLRANHPNKEFFLRNHIKIRTTQRFGAFQHQLREVNPEELIQNPLRPSLMLRQKPSKVFDR